MAPYKFILAYDGTDYSGFQRQGKERTVQGVLEDTLRELGWTEKSILFSGRTDAGVHASGQVATCALDWQHSSADLRQALNARLPEDVSVLKVSKVEDEFHPRYHASSRKYRYIIYCSEVRHPLRERYAWRVWPKLDIDHLNEAAGLFTGRHDFKAFGRAMKKDGSTIREVFASRWITEGDTLYYEVEANAFLYHMVRRLVYVQVRFARGGLSSQEIVQALDAGSLLKPGLAPAHGLTLVEVKFSGNRDENSEDETN